MGRREEGWGGGRRDGEEGGGMGRREEGWGGGRRDGEEGQGGERDCSTHIDRPFWGNFLKLFVDNRNQHSTHYF